MQQKNKIDKSQLNSSPKNPLLENFLELAQFNQGKVVAVSNFHKAKKTGFVV